MRPALVILRAGPACSVQDAGRMGYLRFGVTPAGPMDWIGFRTANLLAGSPLDAAAVEVGPAGLTLVAEGGMLRLGLCAPGFDVRREGSRLPTRSVILLRPGAQLDLAPGRFGMWAYIAPSGGIALTEVMGSLATHARSGLGPLDGQVLARGMTVPLHHSAAPEAEEACLYEPAIPPLGPIRFVPGPQDDYFAPDAWRLFMDRDYAVSPRSDRMAWRLDGPRLAHAKGHDIVSDGVALGAIQVPGDGMPLVLMADRQPTGGYPKIGCVIRADLPKLAQTRPGRPVRFRPVTRDEAVIALRHATAEVDQLAARLRRMRTHPG